MSSLLRRRTTPACRYALVASLALVLGGCSTSPGKVSHYTPAPAAIQEKVDCLAPPEWHDGSEASQPASDLRGSVPGGFVPVQVVRCQQDFLEQAGVYTRVVRQEHLEGDYSALLAALAQPSDRANGNMACTADAELLPALWLVNADGQAIHVVWPVDACGKARGKPDTAKALAGLTVGEVQVQTEKESGQ
ncbi:hypothetical protein [Arthrobacter alpinus]|uniref:hypothetical protein n=1 Tax=Arthrobacter alpinus TaxID=656366 RepID=UPI0012FF3950|nr:hypothetical protein [Arthrobacter alpinus]